jgi:glutamate N-acetyltransferase/amino-acid N-acetyltransferase
VSVTAAKGFEASGVRAGIRREAPDVALVRSTEPAVGAAMFTANRVQAAPLVVSRQALAAADPQAVVVNSGIANAATGPQGDADARETAARTAGLLGLEPEQVLVLSTGVIGVPLPMGPRRPPRSSPPTRGPRSARSRAPASRSAGWRRAPG